MAGTTITVSIKGTQQTIRVLNAAAKAAVGKTSTFTSIGKYLTGFFSGEVFASRGAVIDEPWPKLNDRYAAWKAKHYPGRPPLVRTGQMQHNFRYQAATSSVRVYNPTSYFKYHQTGEGVPKRVMMAVDRTRREQIATIVAENIKAGIISASR